jgi:hypothetical protein
VSLIARRHIAFALRAVALDRTCEAHARALAAHGPDRGLLAHPTRTLRSGCLRSHTQVVKLTTSGATLGKWLLALTAHVKRLTTEVVKLTMSIVSFALASVKVHDSRHMARCPRSLHIKTAIMDHHARKDTVSSRAR